MGDRGTHEMRGLGTPHSGPHTGTMGYVRRYVGYFALVLFAVLLAAGLAMHEFETVLAIANAICLSCIGIG